MVSRMYSAPFSTWMTAALVKLPPLQGGARCPRTSEPLLAPMLGPVDMNRKKDSVGGNHPSQGRRCQALEALSVGDPACSTYVLVSQIGFKSCGRARGLGTESGCSQA